MYTYNTKIRLFHTDAAGIIFYSNIFDIAYECMEEFLEESGFGIKNILAEGIFITPVVHAEADYFKPLRTGDKITIIMSLISSGKNSFAIDYDFFNASGEKAAKVMTVHVPVDPKSGKSIKIPDKLFGILKSLNK